MPRAVYVDCSAFMRDLLPGAEWAAESGLELHVGDPPAQALRDMLGDCVVALNGHTMMDGSLLKACPMLRSIVFLGTGASSYIDIDAAADCNIRVRTIKGYGDRSVAEHAFALMLSAARRVAAMDRTLRAGGWDTLAGTELHGKLLGIIGAGGIGRTLADIAYHFGMRVQMWNRHPVPIDPTYEPVALETLLRTSDIVSLHLALTPETRGFLDEARLRLMQPHAILVNTARGGLLDDAALVSMLRQDRLAHAALDVFDVEPLPAGRALATLDNVTLTAHAGFKTPEASRRLLRSGLALLRADLASLASGQEPRS